MPIYPEYLRSLDIRTKDLASKLGVPYAQTIGRDGLYVKPRRKRDPINTNRKRIWLKVRLQLKETVVFEEMVDMKSFPTEHLIAKLALLI